MNTLQFGIVCCLFVSTASAEIHSLTLAQALDVASKQNPDVALARLDQQRAEQGIKVALDPFRPKIYGGSGVAYTYGYPSSIDGNAPSLAQVKTEMAIFNRPKSYEVASARETARGSQFGAQSKAEEVAYQAADLFLTALDLAHRRETVTGQLPSLQRVLDAVGAAVTEGTELPLERRRAQVNLAASQDRLTSIEADEDYFQMMLAIALGYPANDRIKPIDSDLSKTGIPGTEAESENLALRNNRQLRQMESTVLAKELDVKSFLSARLPQVDLVAQYALFARYNYINYFQKFQNNNFQVGFSITLPLLVGPASKGLALQTSTDMLKIRVQMDQLRNRIAADTHRSYDLWKRAESTRDLARLQLDLAREELTVLLAQHNEGKISLSDLEKARLAEGDRWIAVYEAETAVTRAKLAILRQTGTLLAMVRAGTP